MEKTRVKKGEKFWFIDLNFEVCLLSHSDQREPTDDWLYDSGNYFATLEEAEAVARKLRAVLNGADVIEMPSEEEIEKRRVFWDHTDARTGFGDCLRWLKSKIVK